MGFLQYFYFKDFPFFFSSSFFNNIIDTLWACVHILQLVYVGASLSHSGIKRAAKIASKPEYINSKTALEHPCGPLKMVIIPLATTHNRS